MSDLDFVKIQHEFTRYIRNPEKYPKPKDIEQRRLDIYTDLFYNNVEGFISGSFPVLKEIIQTTRWHEIVRNFFECHASQTPYFFKISEEFILYLQQEYIPLDTDPAFLLELAHYEWMELVLDVATEEIDLTNVDPEGDLLNSIIVLSPLVQALTYQYPVHLLSVEYQPEAPVNQPTCILIYRNQDYRVGFVQSNPVTHRLIELLNQNKQLTGKQVLELISQEMQHPNPQVVIDGGLATLNSLREHDIVLGTLKSN
jgi:hypothetical protein